MTDLDDLLQLAREAFTKSPAARAADTTADYERAYLKSPLWLRIRRRVLKRDARKCLRCGGQGSIVHHLSYEPNVLAGLDDSKLMTVCEGCHTVIHFRDDGTKRAAEEAEQVAHETPPREIPEPRFDMRRTRKKYPDEWPRMTAVQRATWIRLYNEARLIHLARARKPP